MRNARAKPPARPSASPAPKILVENNIEARMRDDLVLRADSVSAR